MSNIKNTISESFIQYSGAVLQSRALVDVRDCLKPSARQIFYSMLENKLIHKNPYKKTANAVGMAMAGYYIHGDSSCTGVIMRAGQDFAMRYPLVDVKGNMGSLMESGNWAAMRYTESRLGTASELLFNDIKKDTIEEWRDNYDNTKKYPSVLPSKGFYNIVNGSTGIGIGMASSIPQFNIKDVNEALIKLLWNPDIDFEDIYCAPDFATGAILLNEDEVKESLKTGQGFSCKLRSVIEYDSDDRCFIVTEIPYGVYTNTICKQIEEIANSEDNPGIERLNDLTKKTPLIKIYLSKRANVSKVLKYLYKNTSLQSHFGINFTMLDKGRYPKVFNWKTALSAYLEHEMEIYTRSYQFDERKIIKRLNIISGLLIAMANIDEVVAIIKGSESTQDAANSLQSKFLLNEEQTKAILDMKLSRLAHLEIAKLENEKIQLENDLAKIREILNNENLIKAEIEKDLKKVAASMGDERRTKIMNVESEEDEEPKEVQDIMIYLSNKNNIYVSEVSSLYTQRRGGVGSKFRMKDGEYVISSTDGTNIDTILIFTNTGNCYHTKLTDIPFGEKIPIESIIDIKDEETVKAITTVNRKEKKDYIVFLTRNGILKKTAFSEYNIKRRGSIKSIKLDADDEINSILFVNDEKIAIMTEKGYMVLTTTNNINPIGRVTRGVKGINLSAGDHVVSAHIIHDDTTEFVTISKKGYAKRTDRKEFLVSSRGTRGTRVQKLKDDKDSMVDFEPISSEDMIVVVASNSQIKIRLNEISKQSKGAQGVKSIKAENSEIIGISIF